MNRFFLLITMVLALFSSCRTQEKIVYFQDLQNGESFSTQTVEAMKLQPGDKVSIIVSSAATPEQALRYNLVVAQQQVGSATARQNNQVSLYTIDEHGEVDIPCMGRIKIGGLTRSDAAAKIQNLFRNGILNDAVVTLSAYDQFITVLGDVKNPGRIQIGRDNITLLEALGGAGDLNITARRDRLLVLRQEGNETKSYYVDIRSKDLMNSPVYNLRQNDVVVVQPNKFKANQSTNNANSLTQIGTWISIASFATTLVTLFLIKK